jgi:hypothetical protein
MTIYKNKPIASGDLFTYLEENFGAFARNLLGDEYTFGYAYVSGDIEVRLTNIENASVYRITVSETKIELTEDNRGTSRDVFNVLGNFLIKQYLPSL